MSKTLNILVVEDYEVLRIAMVELLARQGHKVVGVAMAEDVDDEPLGFLPELYVIDLNLPGEDGLSLVKRIRQSHPHVAIILASARTSLKDRVDGYVHGADVYLPKPVATEELLAVVRNLGQRIERQMIRGDARVVLHTTRMLVKGPIAQAGLTQAEVVLLGALARAVDRKLEHWQVAQHLSGGQEISKDNLEVRLGRLRKKLVACGAESPAIKVIRGEGYKLCCNVEVLSS
jgi:DNA-binding response OmpR family regulator